MFQRNLSFARDMVATAIALKAQLASVMNVDDLLRAALVQGVSAFDHYVHEEVRVRMLEVEDGKRPRPPAFGRFRVSLDAVQRQGTAGGVAWLDDEIRSQHGFVSFQHPDKVADAFRLVTAHTLWDTVAAALSQPAGDIKRQLMLVVDRRNKIAHEADIDPTPPPSRYPINETLVVGSLDFLERLVTALDTVP